LRCLEKIYQRKKSITFKVQVKLLYFHGSMAEIDYNLGSSLL